MLYPPFLKPGDRVGIVSTARKITPAEIKHAVSVLELWGLKVESGATIGLSDRQFAGTDRERAADFQRMLDDDGIRLILCARGGYGTVRIADSLDLSRFIKQPKWIAGFSDITVLHAHLQSLTGTCTLHCAMPYTFPAVNHSPSLESMRKALFGEPLAYDFDAHPLNRPGVAEGILAGGNLSVLYSLLGSRSFPSLNGKILFLEDIDEYLYHIDRMLVALKRAGKLDGLAGLVAGSFTDMKDNETPYGKRAEEIVSEHTAGFSYPVCFGFPAGHREDNRALVMGAKVRVEVGKICRMKFNEPNF